MLITYIKYLWLYINSQLKWKKHIDYLVNLIRRFFYIFHNLVFILDKKKKHIERVKELGRVGDALMISIQTN